MSAPSEPFVHADITGFFTSQAKGSVGLVSVQRFFSAEEEFQMRSERKYPITFGSILSRLLKAGWGLSIQVQPELFVVLPWGPWTVLYPLMHGHNENTLSSSLWMCLTRRHCHVWVFSLFSPVLWLHLWLKEVLQSLWHYLKVYWYQISSGLTLSFTVTQHFEVPSSFWSSEVWENDGSYDGGVVLVTGTGQLQFASCHGQAFDFP